MLENFSIVWGSVLEKEVRTVIVIAVEYYIWRVIQVSFYFFVYYLFITKFGVSWLRPMNFDGFFLLGKLLIWKYLLSYKVFESAVSSLCYIDIFFFFILLLIKFLCRFYILYFYFLSLSPSLAFYFYLFTIFSESEQSFWTD